VDRKPDRRRRLRLLWALAAVVSLWWLAPTLGAVYGDLDRLWELDARWLVLAAVFEIASFVWCWDLLRVVLRVDRWRDVASSQLAGNAVSQIVPGGGPAGAAVQLRMLTQQGCDVPTAVAGLTVSGVLSTAGLLALPLIAIPTLWSGAHVDPMLSAGLWASVILFLVVAAAALAVTRERVLLSAARRGQRIATAITRGRAPDDVVEQVFTQRRRLHEAIRENRGRAFAASIGQALCGCLVLYFVLLAAGGHPSLVVVLAAFAVANLAGTIPVTPAGLGFVEAGLAGALTLGGVPAPTALLAAVAYRLVSSWIPGVVGLAAYTHYRLGRSRDLVLEVPQTRSMMMAGAMPPPAHIVMSPNCRSRRSSSSSTVPTRIAPVAPIG